MITLTCHLCNEEPFTTVCVFCVYASIPFTIIMDGDFKTGQKVIGANRLLPWFIGIISYSPFDIIIHTMENNYKLPFQYLYIACYLISHKNTPRTILIG